MVLTRKPWLLVTEFMKYKDLGGMLQKAKRYSVKLRIHELLHLAVQIADCLVYLADVRLSLEHACQ